MIGSTYRDDRDLAGTDVLVETEEGFVVQTVFDCRFVFTIRKDDVLHLGEFWTTLGMARMREIETAIALGLGII